MKNARFSVFLRKNTVKFEIYFDISGQKANFFYFYAQQNPASATSNKDEIRTVIVVFLSAKKSFDGEICHIGNARQFAPRL